MFQKDASRRERFSKKERERGRLLTHGKNIPLSEESRGHRETQTTSDVKLSVLRVELNHGSGNTVLDDVRFLHFWVAFWVRVRKRN